MPIPIYIISYNRVYVLKKAIASYLKVVHYTDLVIIDNGSDLKELLVYLEVLKSKGVTVLYNKKIKSAAELNTITPFIEAENLKRNNDYYIVTDPDISIADAPTDILDIYVAMLEKFPDIDIVGPMLTIIDIPRDYPAREFAWQRHVEQFWRKKPLKIELDNKIIHYQYAKIDTTFGLLRSRTPYQRLLNGLRIYAPYEATHLDWYITPDNITDDQLYYLEAVSGLKIAHWSGSFFKNSPQEFLTQKERNIFIVATNAIQKYTLPSVEASLLRKFQNSKLKIKKWLRSLYK